MENNYLYYKLYFSFNKLRIHAIEERKKIAENDIIDEYYENHLLSKYFKKLYNYKENKKKIAIEYNRNLLLLKYFKKWYNLREYKNYLAIEFNRKVLLIKYFDKWYRNKDIEIKIPKFFCRIYFKKWIDYINYRKEKYSKNQICYRYYKYRLEKRCFNNWINYCNYRINKYSDYNKYDSHYNVYHNYFNKLRFIRKLKYLIELKRKSEIIRNRKLKTFFNIWHFYCINKKAQRIRHIKNATEYLKIKYQNMMEDYFYAWKNYVIRGKIQKNKEIRAKVFYNYHLTKKYLYIYVIIVLIGKRC